MSSGANERPAGRYRLIEQLGRGGVGVVWRALDEVLAREARASATGGGTTTGGGGATGGAGDPAPAPVCHAVGGARFNCEVWRTATSYSRSGSEKGVLNAGTNHFYCQVDLGRRETYGRWTNVWWARTDDDSGNADVCVSVVYVKGGDNDRPVPGLPLC
ncbi:hypothetical protein [Streptomyces sp. NPDC059881]|uniref:hypothetical protein n=1 Tax=Streptomyces sp. NPDC059881 TaxID=3346986 RepID=UPI00365F2080